MIETASKTMLKKPQSIRGFTLMELLVVIAIIATLAAVILASLNDARVSGSDASIKQGLGNIRSQAGIYYNQNNFSFDGLCSDPDIVAVRTGLNDFNGGVGTECSDTTNAWAISSVLISTSTEWCIDSTDFIGERVTPLGPGEVVCPAS